MCFGSNNSTPAAAPSSTPSTPVNAISAGTPTVTVTPNPPTNPAPNETRVPPASQVSNPNSGVNM